MSLIWEIYWPLLLVAALIGLIGGRIGFWRPKMDDDASPETIAICRAAYQAKRNRTLRIAILLLLAAVAIWHWPAGGGGRFASAAEKLARAELEYFEMVEIQTRISRAPLTRSLVLSGPANDYQRGELVRIMGNAPGISWARWDGRQPGLLSRIPLVVEVALLSLLCFGLGLALAFFVEIRRRANAEWSW